MHLADAQDRSKKSIDSSAEEYFIFTCDQKVLGINPQQNQWVNVLNLIQSQLSLLTDSHFGTTVSVHTDLNNAYTFVCNKYTNINLFIFYFLNYYKLTVYNTELVNINRAVYPVNQIFTVKCHQNIYKKIK